jgi:hypothetical protein
MITPNQAAHLTKTVSSIAEQIAFERKTVNFSVQSNSHPYTLVPRNVEESNFIIASLMELFKKIDPSSTSLESNLSTHIVELDLSQYTTREEAEKAIADVIKGTLNREGNI